MDMLSCAVRLVCVGGGMPSPMAADEEFPIAERPGDTVAAAAADDDEVDLIGVLAANDEPNGELNELCWRCARSNRA